jgi:hypothetical protein
MIKWKLCAILVLVLYSIGLNLHAQESIDWKKNTIFLGASLFHYKDVPGFQASFAWWIIPNVTYQRLIGQNSKLTLSFVEFSYNYQVNELYKVDQRVFNSGSIQYGHKIVGNGNFSVYLNGGIAIRYLGEVWVVSSNSYEQRTDDYHGTSVGTAFRLDANYLIKGRININPHIDYQYYFDGRARQFFMGVQVGYNFGK